MKEEKKIFIESRVETVTLLPEYIKTFHYLKPFFTFKKKKEEEKEKISIEKLKLITKDNKYLMEKKYGKQTFCIKDSANRRLYVWKHIVNENVTLWVITAPEIGTSIEFENKLRTNCGSEVVQKIEEIFNLSSIEIK